MLPPDEHDIDDAVDQTFPASDPPSHSVPTTAGPSRTGAPSGEDSIQVWRVVAQDEADTAFRRGGQAGGGRWTTGAPALVHASGTPAGALLEYLVHRDGPSTGPLVLASARIARDLVEVASALPSTWRDTPYRADVQAIGDEWLAARRTFALQVPSALCPDACNVLLNTGHVDAVHLQPGGVEALVLDPRLERSG